MYNIDDSIMECKKYLKSLQKTINNNTKFTFFEIKVVSKSNIDDILCCLEASFPDEYKKLLKRKNINLHTDKHQHQYTSLSSYQKIKESIQRKWFLSSNEYSVKYKEIPTLLENFSVNLEKDIRFLYDNL